MTTTLANQLPGINLANGGSMQSAQVVTLKSGQQNASSVDSKSPIYSFVLRTSSTPPRCSRVTSYSETTPQLAVKKVLRSSSRADQLSHALRFSLVSAIREQTAPRMPFQPTHQRGRRSIVLMEIFGRNRLNG